MGTRHLIRIWDSTGELRVAQYGQYDGYIDGVGKDIVTMWADLKLGQEEGLAEFDHKLQRLKLVSGEEIQKLYPAILEHTSEAYPQWSRRTSTDIIKYISLEDLRNPPELKLHEPILMYDKSRFIENTVFCEYAYDIDLKANEFRVFKPNNTSDPVVSYRLTAMPDVPSFLSMTKATIDALYE